MVAEAEHRGLKRKYEETSADASSGAATPNGKRAAVDTDAHLCGLRIKSEAMDKIVIVAADDNADAAAAAKEVRGVRGAYVDDLRLWLQQMPPRLFREWLRKKGKDEAAEVPDTELRTLSFVSLNGTELPGGLAQLRAHLPYWRGDKFTRDVGVQDRLLFVHRIHEALSSTSAIFANKATKKAYVINPLGSLEWYADELRAHDAAYEIEAVLLTHIPFDSAAVANNGTVPAFYTGKRDDVPRGTPTLPNVRVVGPGEVRTLALCDDVTLRVVPTPGHARDGLSFVLDVDDEPAAVFPGDAVMVDTVGRTDTEYWLRAGKSAAPAFAPQHEDPVRAPHDAAEKAAALAAAAEQLFRGLEGLLTDVPDTAVIFPTHFGNQFTAHSVEPKVAVTLRLLKDGANHAVTLLPSTARKPKKDQAQPGLKAFAEHCSQLAAATMPFTPAFVASHADNLRRVYHGGSAAAAAPPRLYRDLPVVDARSLAAPTRAVLDLHLGVAAGAADEATAAPSLLVDIRRPGAYAARHIKGSVSFPAVEGVRFEHFFGAMVSRRADTTVLLVADEATPDAWGDRALERLRTVGAEGEVAGRVLVEAAAPEQTDSFARLESHADLRPLVGNGFLDVRSVAENASQSVDGCAHAPLEAVAHHASARAVAAEGGATVAPSVVFCAGGFRSFIAASIERAYGIPSTDVVGGGLTVMSKRPDLWTLKDPQVKCTS